MRNLWLKLASLLCAVLLSLFVNYFLVANEQGDRVVQLIAPVEVRNVPDGRALIWPANKQVEITIQGSSLFMSKVTLSPPVVKISLPEQPGKKYLARLSAADISLPATVRLLAIKPSELEFELDDIIEKNLKVVVPQIGELSEELKLIRISTEPAEVKIKGPARELESVSRIETAPLNLTAVVDSNDIELELRNPGIMSELQSQRVKSRVEVQDAIAEMSFQNLPLRIDVADPLLKDKALSFQPKTVGVRIKASKKTLKDISKEDLLPYILLENESQLGSYLDIKTDLNKHIEDLQIVPNKALVSLSASAPATTIKEPGKEKSEKHLQKN